MKRLAVIISMIVWGSLPLFTQTLTPELSNALQKTLDSRNLNIRGASAAICFPDGSIWTGVRGYSSDTVKIDSSMLFIVASITKHFIGPLVVKLAEEELFSLDDSIYHWIPSNKNIDSTITIKQLLTHTSGIGGGYIPPDAASDKIWESSEILKYAESPVFSPGEGISYSNTAFTVLSMIIDSVTHKPVKTVLREKVLEPYGLNSTFFYPFEDYTGNIARPWTEGPGAYNFFSPYSMSWLKGSGNMLSTPHDLVVWSKNLMKGNFLNEQNTHELMTPQTEPLIFGPGMLAPVAIKVQFSYGSGCQTDSFNLVNGPITLIGHAGLHLKTRSFLFYSPEKDISIAVCINDGVELDYCYYMLSHLFQTFLSGKASSDIIIKHRQDFSTRSWWREGHVVDTVEINSEDYDYSSVRFKFKIPTSKSAKAFSLDNETGIISVKDPQYLQTEGIFYNTIQVYPNDSLNYLIEEVKVSFSIIVSAEQIKTVQLEIYPNPTNGILTIGIFNPQNADIEIFNINGSLVYSKPLKSNQEQIDLSAYPKGVYFVKVRQQGLVKVEKVVLE
jgi:CubicO group peptidase (beta-lactamase class C family)